MIVTKLGVTLVTLFVLLRLASGSIPGAPTDLVVTGNGSRSINISWSRPVQDGNNSQLNYAVLYREKGSNVLRVVEVQDVTKATLSVKPYMKYLINVMAGNKDGYGPSTLTLSVFSLEEEPEKCPSILYADERLGNRKQNLVIIWDEVPEKYHNGIIKGYVIFYFGRTTSIKNVTINDPSETKYTFHNLSKEENYGFRVTAYTSAGLCKGYKNIPWEYEFNLTKTEPPTTAAAPTTTAAAPTTTAAAAPTTTAAAAAPTTTAAAAPTTTAAAAPTTTAATEVAKTTTKPKEPTEATVPSTSQVGCETQRPTPGEKLASTQDSNWLIYVLIAMAAIVAIMGVTILLLTWQLYKNRRSYRTRSKRYEMRQPTPNMGTDNQAQDNAV